MGAPSTDAIVAAFAAARAAGDPGGMADAALALPQRQRFGAHPGQIPVLLFEAYEAAVTPAMRCRLAAALARSWVYGGDAARGAAFAEEAERLAGEVGAPELVADALDAALVCRWGPDDFAARVSLAARLDDTAAHLAGVDLRLSAHLWRLTTAWECLDLVAVQRQLRALDLLADESHSPRVAFFAASRRAMQAVTVGDLAMADALIARAREVGADAGEPDVEAVLHSLTCARARRVRDEDRLRAEAASYEAFGLTEGIPSVIAEGAVLWLEAGDAERAAVLAEQLLASGFVAIARDVDFLLTSTSALAVATALGWRDVAIAGVDALRPYAGRGVINAGAVAFHGVVDDYLYRAATLAGDPAAPQWRHGASSAYRRLGATWWELRLGEQPEPRVARIVHLHVAPDGGWEVGRAGATVKVPDARGLHYLRYLVERPGIDVPARTLVAAVAGRPEVEVRSDAGEIADREALVAYRRRLVQLDAELDAADARGDRGAAERLHGEREALLREVRGATGLGGRPRRAGSTDERARIAVRKAIAAAVSRLEPHDAAVARLLRERIRTGTACRYEPPPDVDLTWVTAPRGPNGDAPR